MRAPSAPVIVIFAVVALSVTLPVAWQHDTSPLGRFNAAAFARGVPGSEELAARFAWPAVASFRTTHAQAVGAKPIRNRETWGTSPEQTADGTVGAPSLDPRAWEDWTYTTTLLAIDRPVYDPLPRDYGGDQDQRRRSNARLEEVEEAMKRGKAAGLAAIRSALAERVPLDEYGWVDVARFAEAHGAVDLGLAVRARHMPVGACSMDDRPQWVAREFADVCFSVGRLACFLNLQVQIMGDQFDRVAYSSWGEAAHDTQVARLRDVGIDVEKFLRGLLYEFEVPGVERRGLGPWRLARSIHEANLGPQMASVLRADAARPDLDDYNRFRAADTLGCLRYHQGMAGVKSPGSPAGEKRSQELRQAIRAELDTLGLPLAAKGWVSSWGQ